jgi:hypothetical protein
MAVPTLPVIEGAQTERKSAATAVVVIWKGRVEHLPDPTRNGEKVAGLSGQLFLHDARMHPASANGRLTVAVYDETPLPAGQTGNVPEVWVFRADDLKKLATPDERFGQCYSLFLPWPAYRPGVTRVRIAVRYEPENGRPLHAPEARLTLDPPAKPEVAPASAETPKAKKNKKQAAEEFPGILLNVYSSDPSILNAVPPLPRATEPTAPPMAVPAPPMPSEYPKAKKKKKQAAHALPGILLNQYSSDPNVRMQQLLYQSEDLRQMQNEWRRFWFNDHPSHLTPERIHGGIQ